MGVALGVVFGAILQVIVSLIGLFGLGFDYRFKIYWKNMGFRSVLKLLPARSLDQGIDYVNTIVNTNLSSRMGAGALRSYQQANTLHQMPVNLIGVAISTAFFPKLTEETGENESEKFNSTFRQALRMITWITLPVVIITYFTRGYVVNFIKNGGDPLIASVLATMIIAIFAQSLFHIASRGFYARQDTKTPFIISIIAIGLNMVLAVVFTKMGYGPEGLGWAQSIGAILEIIILLVILNHRSKYSLLNKEFWSATIRMFIATAAAGITAYILTKLFPLMATDESFLATFPKFLFISVVSIAVYIIASLLLNIDEAKPVAARIGKIVFPGVKRVKDN
jgi:putative peptidoglycan lipid II flippase